jgi:hypothetical protein
VHADSACSECVFRLEGKWPNELFAIDDNLQALRATLANQNFVCEEINETSLHERCCCHSVQNILYCSLLSYNIQTKIYRTIRFPVVLCGCGIWPVTVS